jgi:hypothetical protein
MTEVYIGIAASACFLIFIAVLAARYRMIFYPIVLGGAIRLVLTWVIGLRLAEIQGTTSDAVAFERVAREWALLSWGELFAKFDPSNSYIISFLGALLYKLAAPSAIMLNIVNAAISVYLIVLCFRLTTALFGQKRAKAVAWIVALFPFAVLYGSVFRREVFGSLFFTLGLMRTAKWASTDRMLSLAGAFVCFVIAGMFHGGLVVGIVGLGLIVVGDVAHSIFSPARHITANRLLSAVVGAALICVMSAYLLVSGFSLNKLGELGEVSIVEAVEARTVDRTSDGGSSFPTFLTGANPFSNPIIIPGRFVYFLLSPFPWDIRSPNHLLGFAATAVYLYIVIGIIRSWRTIYASRKALAVFSVLAVTVAVFSISIDNVGTSIRHRTKFLFGLIALCAVPQFPTILFRTTARPKRVRPRNRSDVREVEVKPF